MDLSLTVGAGGADFSEVGGRVPAPAFADSEAVSRFGHATKATNASAATAAIAHAAAGKRRPTFGVARASCPCPELTGRMPVPLSPPSNIFTRAQNPSLASPTASSSPSSSSSISNDALPGLTAHLQSLEQHVAALTQRLNMPNLIEVETKVQPLAPAGPGGPPIFKILPVLVGPNQSLQKLILEQWDDGTNCYRTTYKVGFQFTGYGGYCLSFEKDLQHSNLFGRFFNEIASYGVNFHRTILFVNENLENNNPANAGNLQRLLLDGNGQTTSADPHYLTQLDAMVSAAAASGVVVQVCLFMHHSVAGTGGATTPKPVVLTGTPAERYKAFYSTASAFLPMQGNLIDGVVNKLKFHWNVVYEIGNELRVDGSTPGYGEAQLKTWIDWAAARVRASDPGHLITVSTGIANEQDVDTLPHIQFCSFHQGQWKTNIDAACDRAKNDGGKHLVIDDDGGTRPIGSVQAWSLATWQIEPS